MDDVDRWRRCSRFTLLAVACLLAACAPEEGGLEEEAASPALLPAHRTEAERLSAGKGDDLAAWRLAHPEWFAVTVPPSQPVRAMREWEPMSMVLAAWPSYLSGDKGARDTVVAMLGHTVKAETDVGVVVETNTGAQDLIGALLAWGLSEADVAARVAIWQVPIDSVWFIDFGPFPVVDEALGRTGFVDFRYFKSRLLDDALPSRLALAGASPSGHALPATVWRAPFDFEGGNLQADGEGGCYTTTRALQNTGATQGELAGVLRDYVGCQSVVVLQDLSDDATGHIDMFFKLTRRDLAIVGAFDGAVVVDAKNAERMDKNAASLGALPGMQVLRMPFPAKAGKTPRTFLNATLVNGVNLWPVYKDDGASGALQSQAAAVWAEALPDWEHIPILSDRLAELSGAIHCVSRTLPAFPVAPIVAPGICKDGLCLGPPDGHDGACQTPADCQGARWECPCPVCNGSCGAPPCGDIPAAGTCVGAAVVACVGGSIQVTPCDGCCAFDGLAKCATECGCLPACGDGERGCDGDLTWTCDTTECPRRIYESCDGGGCMDGACRGCAGIGAVGCCNDAATAVACGADGLLETPCEGATCGWSALGGFYGCVPEEQALLEDPSGAHPISCPGACVHACAAGSSGCAMDGAGFWTCVAGPSGCRIRKDTACLPGRTCVGEACVAPGTGGEPGSGGAGGGAEAQATSASGCGPGSPWGTVALWVALAWLRRGRPRHKPAG